MNAKALRDMTEDELRQKLRERRDDLIAFRMQMTTGVVDDVRSAREARKDIARILTIRKERQRAAAKGEA